MGIRLRHMWRFEYWTKSDKEPYIYNQYVSNEFFTREEAEEGLKKCLAVAKKFGKKCVLKNIFEVDVPMDCCGLRGHFHKWIINRGTGLLN